MRSRPLGAPARSGSLGPRALWVPLGALLLAACSSDPKVAAASEDPRCSGRADCQGGLVCRIPTGTSTGACGLCERDRECERIEVCDPTARTCTYREGWGADCAVHGDCPLGRFCVQGLCVPGGAVVDCFDGGCPEGDACHAENKVCEEDLGCGSDGDCAASQRCDPSSARCVDRCTDDNAAELCGALQCIDGKCSECAGDSDCGPGLSCDVEIGRCGSELTCHGDRDCIRPLVCNAGTGQCTDEPRPCNQNGDCPREQVCRTTDGVCIPKECPPDDFEPNDDAASAPQIEAERYTGLSICRAEEDWFGIDLVRGDRIDASIEGEALAQRRFEVRLESPDGRIQRLGQLDLQHTTDQSGRHHLVTTSPEATTNYGLRVLLSQGTPCDDDLYEPNEGFRQASPTGPFEGYNLVVCAGTEDWYVLELPRDRSLRATLDHDPAAGDLDLWIVDGDAVTILAQSTTAAAEETAVAAGTGRGRAFVRVAAGQPIANTYDLRVEVY